MSVDVDVVIVGAGAAGLAAAIELQRANLSFVILEARNRVGGRACTDRETFTPTPVDLGASWIHSCGFENPLYEYHQMLMEKTEPTDGYGQVIDQLSLDYDGQPLSLASYKSARMILEQIFETLDKFVLDTNNDDDRSVEQVIQTAYERLVEPGGQVQRMVDFLLSGTEQYDGSDLAHLSAKSWGIDDAPGGDLWVSSGYGRLLERISNKYNLPIRLNILVTRIDTHDNNRIAITISDSSSILFCRRVLITIPLGCLKRDTIVFEPPLPDWKREAIDRMGCGLMNKLILQFPHCFWGTKTRVISHACNERRGRFRCTICLPPPANILILLVTGPFAQELENLTDSDTLELIMKFFRQIFPHCLIPDPIKYKFTRWSQDPLAYSSYSNFAVHSNLHTIEQLAKETADGRVHWAGEHANANDSTENWSFGCVHSAFQSGQKAAKAIRYQLCDS